MQLPEHSYPTPVDGDEAECADVDYSIDVHQHDTARFPSESAPGDGNNYFSEAELEILEYSTMMTEQQAQHDQGKIYKRGFEAFWLTAEQSISIHSSSSWQQRVGRGRRSRMDQQERFRPPRRKPRQTTISINQIRSIFPHLSSVIQTTTTT